MQQLIQLVSSSCSGHRIASWQCHRTDNFGLVVKSSRRVSITWHVQQSICGLLGLQLLLLIFLLILLLLLSAHHLPVLILASTPPPLAGVACCKSLCWLTDQPEESGPVCSCPVARYANLSEDSAYEYASEGGCCCCGCRNFYTCCCSGRCPGQQLCVDSGLLKTFAQMCP